MVNRRRLLTRLCWLAVSLCGTIVLERGIIFAKSSVKEAADPQMQGPAKEPSQKRSTLVMQVPQWANRTNSTGIIFHHLSSPEQKYIVESMSGGVALVDYDRDGWPDIFFTNAQSVEMALAGKKARSALYHNNHDGTFTDVTDKAGVGHPCWAMGA